MYGNEKFLPHFHEHDHVYSLHTQSAIMIKFTYVITIMKMIMIMEINMIMIMKINMVIIMERPYNILIIMSM